MLLCAVVHSTFVTEEEKMEEIDSKKRLGICVFFFKFILMCFYLVSKFTVAYEKTTILFREHPLIVREYEGKDSCVLFKSLASPYRHIKPLAYFD